MCAPKLLQRQLIMSGDGSYTNKARLTGLPCCGPPSSGAFAKDAKLHLPLPASDGAAGRPCLYGLPAPTPEQILQDDSHPRGEEIRCFAASSFERSPGESLWPGLLAQQSSGPICLCCWS